jgi:hypothetical protein
LLASSLYACVSTETISSTYVKTEAVVRTYSVFCNASDGKCSNVAQFRMGDFDGHTLELTSTESIAIDGKKAAFFDSRAPNRVFDALSYVTVFPIFLLYKGGSYYHSEGELRQSHLFEFKDGSGRKALTSVDSRGFSPGISAVPGAPRSFRFRLAERLVEGEALSCVLTLHPGQHQRLLFATPAVADGGYRCDFDLDASPFHGPFRVKVMRSLTKVERDEFGRQVRVVASTEQQSEGTTK